MRQLGRMVAGQMSIASSSRWWHTYDLAKLLTAALKKLSGTCMAALKIPLIEQHAC
jgi:hypothetical protein